MTTVLTSRKQFKVLSISDVHLGNGKTPAKHISQSARAFFGEYKNSSPLATIDLLFIAGDFFDSLLDMASDDIPWILGMISEILRFCERNNIIIRVLEGTRRHDWSQSKNFQNVYDLIGCTADFKYVSTLSIERIEALGLNVLYVPDEWRHTAKATQDEVVDLLKEHGLVEVDCAVMHGMFNFQLGNIPTNPKVHDEGFYLSIVKHFITVGHIHTFMQFDRIIGQGSFDRISHGEEGPKGGVIFTQVEDGSWIHTFVENKHAKIYKSFEIKEQDLKKVYRDLEKQVYEYPSGSEIRLIAKKGHPVLKAVSEIKKLMPTYDFVTKEVVEEEKAVKEVEVSADYTPIILSKDTITEAVHQEVSLNHELSPEKSRKLYEILEATHGSC